MSASSKSRSCPAAGRDIRSYECTDGRHSKYACPDSCPHNPFAGSNYERMLEMERVLDERIQHRFAQQAAPHSGDVQAMADAIESDDACHAHRTFQWLVFAKRDASGSTFVDRWQRDGFAGLKNDTRVLLQAQRQLRHALVEVRRVLDDTRTEVVDLLDPDPQPFLIYDRGLASAANRFSTLVTSLVTLPHYTRIHGNAIQPPSTRTLDPAPALRRLVAFLGGPEDTDGLRRWIFEHAEKLEAATEAIDLARRHQSLKRTQAHFGKAVYRILGDPDECRRICANTPGIEPSVLHAREAKEGFTQSLVWLDKNSSAPTPGIPVIGRILLGPTMWRLEAVGSQRMSTLRENFEAIMGPRARFEGERQDNLAAQLNRETPPYDASLVPPDFLDDTQGLSTIVTQIPLTLLDPDLPADPQSPAGMRQIREAMDRAFLDDHVPALDHKNPRDAARDPILRPRLIRLLKERIEMRDAQSRDDQIPYDAAWLAQELGIDELVLPPPPARPPLELDDDDEDPEDEVGVDPVMEFEGYPPLIIPALEDLPPMPTRQLDGQESGMRLGRAVQAMSDISHQEHLLHYGQQLAIELERYFPDDLTHEEQSLLVGAVLFACLLFYQPGTGAPRPSLTKTNAAFQEINERLSKLPPQPEPNPEHFISASSQPAMAHVAIFAVLSQVAAASASDQMENRRHFKGDKLVALLILTLGVVEAMHREIQDHQRLSP